MSVNIKTVQNILCLDLEIELNFWLLEFAQGTGQFVRPRSSTTQRININ